MTDAAALHHLLTRQLRRLGLDPASSPSPAAWRTLLETLSTTYNESEDERHTLERSIEVSSDEMRHMHEVLSQQATTDYLTGLPNRRALHAYADARLGVAEQEHLALLLLDLDRFKEINDSVGHHVGDQLLIQIGARLGEHLRAEDLLVRLGGDEFAILLGDVLIPASAVRVRVGRAQRVDHGRTSSWGPRPGQVKTARVPDFHRFPKGRTRWSQRRDRAGA